MSTAVAARPAESVLANERIVSADSHIMEPADLWDKHLPASLKAKYPKYPARNSPGEKPGGWMMDRYGEDTFMWSNDYPHAASTWPHSRQVIADELGHLPQHVIRKVVRENVLKLYDLKIDGINT